MLRAYLDGSGRADAGHAEHGGAVLADSGDSLVDLGAFAGGELAAAFGVRPHGVTLVAGAWSPRKILEVECAGRLTLERLLRL